MKSGVMTMEGNYSLNPCKCGKPPELVWHYIKGSANHINYFVRCKDCKIRTENRKRFQNAVIVWNIAFGVRSEK